MRLFLSVFLFLITSGAQAQKAGAADSTLFKKIILHSFDDIFSSWKLDKIEDYYTPDFTILEVGVVWNKDSLVQLLSKRLASGETIKRTNRISLLYFETEGNTAWGSYYNDAVISRNGGPERSVRWLESAVMVKDNKGWRIKMLHSTPVQTR